MYLSTDLIKCIFVLMKMSELGEFSFIGKFAKNYDGLLNEGFMGIGDDCAIIPAGEEYDYLISTDLLVEGVHFLLDEMLPKDLGQKALAVNLSDIAAMGGEPVGTFLSLGIPKDTAARYIKDFMQGYEKMSKHFSVPLLGGDTTSSLRDLCINVAVVGKCPKGSAKLRKSAKNNDIICVTGPLGDSAAGLEIILNKDYLTYQESLLRNRHLLISPRIEEGIWLRNQKDVHAMMDLSDGISSDLAHILKASKRSAEVFIEQLPISPLLQEYCEENHWDASSFAIGGGEDYELLCTVKADSFAKVQESFQAEFQKPLYAIGRICNGKRKIRWMKNGEDFSVEAKTFHHFKSE